MGTMMYSLVFVGIGVTLVIIICLVRFFLLRKPLKYADPNLVQTDLSDSSVSPNGVPSDPLDDPAFHRFRMALAMPTVTPEDKARTNPWLKRFQEFLVEEYPAFGKVAQANVVDDFAIWFKWPGKNEEKKPVLFIAHYDVVPVNEKAWTHDPFEAVLEEGYLYARGALDTKFTLVALMEAVEALAARGFQPDRDVYLAFGGDEERNGTRGAQVLANHFAEEGIRFSWLLDEGSVVADGSLKAARKPLALVALEEKGYVNLVLTVKQAPGHSSRPPGVQAGAVLGKALSAIGKRPLRPRLLPVMKRFFQGIVPLVDRPTGFILANLWLFWPLLHRVLGRNATLAALFRTTMAITIVKGGNTENVLPDQVQAVINCRILPGEHAHDVLEQVKKRIGDKRVAVDYHPDFLVDDPVSLFPGNPEIRDVKDPRDFPGWVPVKGAIERHFPGCPVLPFLNTALTDSRHYRSITDAILRFAPMKLSPREIDRIHGDDERISLENYYTGIAFYISLLENISDS